MEIKLTTDDILINGKSILNNKYKETRKRICRIKGRNDLSDKDIIEYLAEEINGYRSKIEKLEEHIDKLKEKQIEDTKLEENDSMEIKDNIALYVLNGLTIEDEKLYNEQGELISSTTKYYKNK